MKNTLKFFHFSISADSDLSPSKNIKPKQLKLFHNTIPYTLTLILNSKLATPLNNKPLIIPINPAIISNKNFKYRIKNT